ncbi:hypothetical protein GE21DRAFT_1306979 [Neurospora crassa]|nr:hypothetical protein GE21DRAFT_1306979 [Neurospora crassa]
MDVISWGARSTTTVAQWRPISSYGVSASSEGVVAADGIRNDRIKMSRCRGAISREPSSPRQLRSLLLDGEVGDASAATQAIGYQDTHVVSTFRYTADTETVSFRLRIDAVDAMFNEPGEWMVYIWRTVSWEKIGDGLPITTTLETGKTGVGLAPRVSASSDCAQHGTAPDEGNQDRAGPFYLAGHCRAGLTSL